VAILVTCECGQSFETGEQNAGRRAKCPVCGRELVVPRAGPSGSPDDLAQFEPAPSRISGKAIASLILGLLSFLLCMLTGIPAIILGVLGINEVNASKGRVTGSGLATTGIVLGSIGSMGTVAFVLIALLLPAVQAAREAARRAQCTNNLKQIGLAMHNYHDVYGSFPPRAVKDPSGKPLLSWRVLLLPYLEEQNLYNQFRLDEPWDSPTNRPLAEAMPNLFKCPSNPTLPPGMTAYEVVAGPNTIFPDGEGGRSAIRFADITDGTSNTILVGEAGRPVRWTEPDDIPIDTTEQNFGFSSLHRGGWNILMGDGAVRFLKNSIAPAVLKALLSRNGGEVISSDSF
jgi:hypothetical protein